MAKQVERAYSSHGVVVADGSCCVGKAAAAVGLVEFVERARLVACGHFDVPPPPLFLLPN